MYRKAATLALLSLVLLAPGCAVGLQGTPTGATPGWVEDTATPEPGSEEMRVDIQGNISEVQPAAAAGDRLGTIRIEGEKIAGNEYDKAVVSVTRSTQILKQDGDALVPVGFEALSFGDTVTAKFTGQVRESYPVQATASRIEILFKAPRN